MLRKYNLLSTEAMANPYPVYRQLREEDPVHLDSSLGCWLLTRYDHVVTAFANPHLSSERLNPDRLRGKEWESLRPLFESASKQMLFLDPPDHARLRMLLNKAFTPRVINTIGPSIQQMVDQLIEAVVAHGEMDIIQDIAYPLPATVIAGMLGVPAEDHHLVKSWSNDFATFLGNPSMLEKSRVALESLHTFMDYFRRIISDADKIAKSSLLSALVSAEEQGQVLSEDELLANCVLLLFAGHETTTNLIGNGMLALLQNPKQMELLQQDMSLLPTAVDELLRYDSPTQWTGRVVKGETEIAGKRLRNGQGVMIMIGAANRDPEQFIEPDQLDIARRENRHLAFGNNRHFCLGAALARLEAQIIFKTLLQRLPTLQLAPQKLAWRGNLALRALKSLHVTFQV